MRVGVVGNWVSNYEDWPHEDTLESFQGACREIGRSLASCGHRVVAASESDSTADGLVVRAYVEVALASPGANQKVEILRDPKTGSIPFHSEIKKHPHLFNVLPGQFSNVEVHLGFVKAADAILTIGGRKTTYHAGLAAVLAKKQVVPIGSFGGASRQLLQDVLELQKTAHNDQLRSLNNPWTDTIARTVLELLEQNSTQVFSRRIFVVHGRDGGVKNELARLLERLDLEPVILHEQPDRGQTIFAKLQNELADVGFAFVLLTPDDVGSLREDTKNPQARARQNVIFEHGLFVGHLSAARVCAICKGTIELPSDIQGIIYKQIPEGKDVSSIAIDLVKELRAAGYEVDANKV
jgi:predicted nucleotide-binding protein